MPKGMFLDRALRQTPGFLSLPQIPINQYSGNVWSEIQSGRLTRASAIRIYTDMRFARRFEESLQAIKKTKTFSIQGEDPLSFDYGGPAHLRIGEEADAVGCTYLLSPEDLVFGTHGSHVLVVAKALSAMSSLGSAESLSRLEAYHDGELTRITAGIETKIPGILKGVGIDQDGNMAINTFLYGLFAEIFCKETGFNRGLGGSMHAFFLPFGIGPNNAIVGSSANIAAGAAYAELIKNHMREGSPLGFNKVLFNIGDGASVRGPVLETLNWMGMGQYKSWDLGVTGLPLIAHFRDNGYAMGDLTRGWTASSDRLSELFYGFRSDGYHAETVNGNDPLALIDFYRRNFEALDSNGQWPLGVHSETYRISGHSPSDKGATREDAEVEDWKAGDPSELFRKQLISALTFDGFEDAETGVKRIDGYVNRALYAAMKLAVDPEVSPPFGTEPGSSRRLERYMFNTGTTPAEAPKVGRDLVKTLDENPAYARIKGKYDDGQDSAITFREALTLSLMQRAAADARFVSWGEDVRAWEGAFNAYAGFQDLLPIHRHYDAPISEGTIVGAAVGAAMNGMRPVVEIMYSDFLGCAGEELINQMAKWQGMSAGEIRLPMGVRVSVGRGYGAQHSQKLSLNSVPGLYLAYPATPSDVKRMMAALMNQDNPFVSFESQNGYGKASRNLMSDYGLDLLDNPPFEETGCVIGQPQVLREGKDLTLLAFGPALFTAGLAAKRLEEMGISAEVINGRWLVPFDFSPVVESVAKTGRAVVLTEAVERGSSAASIASDLSRLSFRYLKGPVGVVGSLGAITPGFSAQDIYFPDTNRVLDEVNTIISLRGYTPTVDRTAELAEKRKNGN